MADPRAAVRVAALERTLDSFTNEMGMRTGVAVSAALRAYHAEYVVPLEARVAALETPWWRKVAKRLLGTEP